jgi:hypothetical protein
MRAGDVRWIRVGGCEMRYGTDATTIYKVRLLHTREDR